MPHDNFDELMEKHRPTLSEAEVSVLWAAAAKRLPQTSVLSPYVAWVRVHHLAPVAVVLIALLSTGGTVAAAQAARPGDLLFPVERAIERTQLYFASPEREAALRTAFANERLFELEDILAETGMVVTDDSFDTGTSMGSSTTLSFSAEADVFTDVTVIAVEYNDRTQVFTTTETTEEAIVALIAERYGLPTATVLATLDFELEDRASRPSERGRMLVDSAHEARVSEAIGALLDDVEGLDDVSLRDGILSSLVRQIDRVEVRGRERVREHSDDDRSGKSSGDDRADEDDSRIKIKDDRIEIRDGGYRIRIDGDGEAEVKEYGKRGGAALEWGGEGQDGDDSRDRGRDEDESDNGDRSHRNGDGDVPGRGHSGDDGDDEDEFESERENEYDGEENRDEEAEKEEVEPTGKIEVRVENGEAEVRGKYDGQEFEFETVYVSRALLVADISVRTGISEAEVETALAIEVKE